MEWHYEVPTLLQNLCAPSDDEPDDCVCVLSVGPLFRYVIPSFDILAIDMRQMRTLETSSVGVDGMFALLSTLLLSRNRLLVFPDGRVVDRRSLFLTSVPVAMKMPGRSGARHSFYKYITCTSHKIPEQFDIHHRSIRQRPFS